MPTIAPVVLGADLPVRLSDGTTVTYANLDYAATAPCLAAAADAVNELLPWYASVHRGAGAASRRCTLAYEQSRQTVADFLDIRPDDHVIFTRNTTDAMNLLARALPSHTTVVTWAGEHHANLLPWPRVHCLPVPADLPAVVSGLTRALADLRSAGPVLVAVTGASNVTGEVWPIAELAEIAHRHRARIAVDAAQLAPHRPVSMTDAGIDYLALSGHKLYAPFGAGVLAGRADWLDAAAPYLAGGGATRHVGDEAAEVQWHVGPARHEAGTPNLLGAVALAAACATLAASPAVLAHEQDLLKRLRDGLAALPGVAELRTFDVGHDRVGIVSFAVAEQRATEVAHRLAADHGIGVRDGLFCAHPLARKLLTDAAERLGCPTDRYAIRASIGIGTTVAHVDRLLRGLREIVTSSRAAARR
ncbi:aminotransferase class V-fold PLP-dependent enzyme [Micromonospora gifhornensis]|uniref:Cysteine desulfurase n=1 Tax=Micromonospora gifhornensis TaxID=84594 RepID=A0ABQ4ILY1_9ACTN|nr:cysteine desulfurase [Micromonospora gifhornensis]